MKVLGALPEPVVARVEAAELATVKRWMRRISAASSAADVVADP